VKDKRPVLLDLFCKAGGAGAGYYRAGFDVVGVDIEPQPRYPHPFVQADALEALAGWDLSAFAGIHGSPVCKRYSKLTPMAAREGHPDQVAAVRRLLIERAACPWVIENVPGAPLRPDLKLCGCMFGLPGLRRERWFETSWHAADLRPPCHHQGRAITVTGNGGGWSNRDQIDLGSKADREAAMGIDWMTNRELSQAVPPAYTERVGGFLMEVLRRERAA
jgi:DNA (cytosine-5)-methyltransferase 1